MSTDCSKATKVLSENCGDRFYCIGCLLRLFVVHSFNLNRRNKSRVRISLPNSLKNNKDGTLLQEKQIFDITKFEEVLESIKTARCRVVVIA